MRGLDFCIGARRIAFVTATMAAGAMFAGETSAKTSKETIGIELNKLSDEGAGCQAYFVFDNQGGADYGKLKLDLVVFNSDEVIERRFAMEVAPLDAKKRTVKLFELKKISCDTIGSFLINGVLECKEGTKTRKDCVERLVPSSRVDVKITK